MSGLLGQHIHNGAFNALLLNQLFAVVFYGVEYAYVREDGVGAGGFCKFYAITADITAKKVVRNISVLRNPQTL